MSYEGFNANNAAMLLIDHQVGTMSWVHSTSFEEMKMNALMLAQTAQILKMPVVLTSSMEEYAQGPLLSELEAKGLIVSGRAPGTDLCEMIELPKTTHPWFVGCQFHPEFTSSPRHGHPLFTSYVRAAIARQGKA